MQKYEIVRELGTGSYGKVLLARNRRTKEQVAIKEIQVANLTPEARDKAMQEVELLRSLDHPNIVRLRDSFHEKGVLHIVMEYVDGGDLAEMIKAHGTNKPFTEDEILSIFVQMTLAIGYIHDKKIVHRDIKPQNVFMTRLGVVKLGDFGVARALEGTQDLCQTVIGTPYYLSPEVWTNAPYNSMTDIWSLGCILYEMCALKRPFSGRDAHQLFAAVVRGKYDPLPARYSKGIKMLVDSMLSANPNQRPSAEQILQLPFIKTKIMGKIKENEAQLKTVNIIASEAKGITRQRSAVKTPPKRVATPKRPESATKLPRLNQEKDDDMDLPLPPDEEAPRWAQRGRNVAKPDEITVVPREEEPNEYEELREVTNEMHNSLRGSPGALPAWAKDEEDVPMDESSLKTKINGLREHLEQKLGEQLFEMLYENIQGEDDPNCAQFVDIMNESDPELVEQMRELISLENCA